VSGLFLFILMLGGCTIFCPATQESLSAPAPGESEPEDTDEDEMATPVVSSVGVPRSRNTKDGFPPNASLNAAPVPNSRLLILVLPVGTFTKLSGAGISMHC
jgi:hypothetical protein